MSTEKKVLDTSETRVVAFNILAWIILRDSLDNVLIISIVFYYEINYTQTNSRTKGM